MNTDKTERNAEVAGLFSLQIKEPDRDRHRGTT